MFSHNYDEHTVLFARTNITKTASFIFGLAQRRILNPVKYLRQSFQTFAFFAESYIFDD